ncbi:GNAT family N-acetyltransferase [Luteococcus sp. OSA5]|uniref:GNAT family N-acetyltransferase n=1 Tax=Luteococcus sp. OSA5 TaxID=3401630 RepID=UPI003B42CC01
MTTAQPPRVSLLWTGPDGDGGDLVGDLVRADDREVVVLPAGRGPVRVPREQIRAMRKVPPRVVRPTSRVDDLVRLAARGWPGTGVVRMGGWELHTGGGHSRRANSCHPTGTPERELVLAVEQVTAFYRDRGLQPCFQLSGRTGRGDDEPTRLDELLAARGWRLEHPSVFLVADLERADLDRFERSEADAASTVSWSQTPGDEWLDVDPNDHPARVPVLTSAPAHYATLRLGRPIGIGRVVLTQDWAGLSCLFVDPTLRTAGHGSALTIAMMARARELGARYCYLQVLASNHEALRLYEGLGFTEHHRYHYRCLPE